MSVAFDPSQLIGPVSGLVILIIGIAAVWPWLRKSIDDQIKTLQTELGNCHSQHEETRKELYVLRGKIDVLEKFQPGTLATDIVNGVKALLDHHTGLQR
jgi:hypothetical protein